MDNWLIAESVDAERAFLVHNAAPVFVAQIFDDGDAPVAGLRYALSNGQYLAEFTWWGAPPDVMLDRWTVSEEFLSLMAAGDAALAEYDQNLDIFIEEHENDEG